MMNGGNTSCQSNCFMWLVAGRQRWKCEQYLLVLNVKAVQSKCLPPVRLQSNLMFALFFSIHRSNNTTRDGKTNSWLFEGASFALDTGQTTSCKTNFHFLWQAPPGFRLLPPAIRHWVKMLRPPPLHYIRLLREISSACSYRGGLDTLNPKKSFCLIGSANC